MRSQVDLNADVGEEHGIDTALMAIVTSVNIACGGHAGDELSMRRTVTAARAAGVRIGAHPSYPDRAGFGRVSMDMDLQSLRGSILEQVTTLAAVAAQQGAQISYLKPHGALYHDAIGNPGVADALFAAAGELSLPVMLLACAPRAQIREGYIDRGCLPDGTLLPRGLPGALILDPAAAARQAVALAPEVDSLCVHSDTPGAPVLIAAARAALEGAGYLIGP